MPELKHIKDFTNWSKNSTYLLLINPEQIPHLVFIHKGRYYSLTYFGTEINESFTTYFQQLKRLGKKLIFIELNSTLESDEIYRVFCEFNRAGEEGKSCFAPVKELLLPESSSQMVFQLIPELYENQMIKSVQQLGLENAINKDQNFKLSTYNQEDIFSYIQLLKERHDKREKSQFKSS